MRVRFSFAAIASIAAVVLVVSATALRAQDGVKSVADGVYSDLQALRGAAAYDQACGRCHRQDLGGADGPALRDDRFNRVFAGKDLKTLYTRIQTTMPRGAPSSMSESAYLDITAHILKENGFPAGPNELSAEGLAGVDILASRPKPLPPVDSFSYVEVVGCLAPGSDGSWMLTDASDPVPAAAPGMPQYVASENVVSGFLTAEASAKVVSRTSGNQTYRLLDAIAYQPEARRGQKLYVRGLLIKLPTEVRLTISDLKTIEPSCK